MKIALLGGNSKTTPIVYNYIGKYFKIDSVIIENKVSAKILIKKRIRKLGYNKVIGQLLFQISIAKVLKITSKDRIHQIFKTYGLDNTPIDIKQLIRVNSINDEHVIELLKKISPDLIIVNGTRIISEKILDSIPAIFINMHVGITPGYRGVHGAYWAFANNDKQNAGVTIHYVDKGIDTGSVIAQSKINISDLDNFTTYPYLQTAAGLPLMIEAIKAISEGEIPSSIPLVSYSKLWSHPTLYEYVKNYIVLGVK